MRLFWVIPIALALGLASPASAQSDPWINYVNREDQFSIVFPFFPKIEAFTYMSEYESPWKANRYTSEYDGYTYIMTVVDMSTSALTADDDRFRNVGRPGNERRGAMAHAAAEFRKTGVVTLDAYEELQVIPGHKLEIDLPDGRKNIVEIHIHDKRLYILECISPPGAIPGYDVQGSLAILNADGVAMRYQDNDYSFPDHMPLARAFAPSGVGADTGAGPTTTPETAQPAYVD